MHPMPGIKSIFDPCPGKSMEKVPFQQVKQHLVLAMEKIYMFITY